jgi:hypothetical protein
MARMAGDFMVPIVILLLKIEIEKWARTKYFLRFIGSNSLLFATTPVILVLAG